MLNLIRRTGADASASAARGDRATGQPPTTETPLTPTLAPPVVADPIRILDPDVLRADLRAILDDRAPDDPAATAALLAGLRAALTAGRAEIKRRFLEEAGNGDACVAEQAHLLDGLIATLATVIVECRFPAPNPTTGEKLSIVAVGGYGRGEMAPQSDLDLLFLLPYKRTPRVEQVVETLLYLLWDLGLKVGHAVRSIDECMRAARADHTIRTTLLETRPVWGEASLYLSFRQRFCREIVEGSGPDFVEAKLAERDARHRKLGDSRYVLEPNIKEGKGGLRDLQALFWMGKYVYQVDDIAGLVDAGMLTGEEAAGFAKAQTFLRTVRCHLHYLSGRPEERLTFDVQAEMGRRMGYTRRAGTSGVERFMKHYFLVAREVGTLTRIVCAQLEAEHQRRTPMAGLKTLFFTQRGSESIDGLPVESGRVSIPSDTWFRDHPLDTLRLFRVAQIHGLDIHPHALRVLHRNLRQIGPRLREDPAANRLFLEILLAREDPELTLRRMNEADVLGRFIPDFRRVVAQMQYDMYHVYTTDEHTLFAIGILHRLETGQLQDTLPLATRTISKVRSRRALFVAMLCHDIAKGRSGDHSMLGAQVLKGLGPRLGLTPEETETAQWLVRWHLLMSDTAFKRDLEDDKTVTDFADFVASPERLNLLYVLTVADISAVGPNRLTQWKATLLGALYQRTREVLAGGLDSRGLEARVEAAKQALRQRLSTWPEPVVEAVLSRPYPPYWLSFDTPTQVRHAGLIREAEAHGRHLTLDTRIDRARAITEVTVLAPDHPGLFCRLAGAFAVCGATIVDARIFTLTDGMALDVFTVQDAARQGAFDASDRLAKLSVVMERSLTGDLRPVAELAKRAPTYAQRTSVFTVQPRVLFDNDASATHTVIEVNGRDRPGLLYDITRALSGQSLQISSAKISTFGEQAVDVFYVKDVFGLKIQHEGKFAQLRRVLLEALDESDGEGGVRPAEPGERPAVVPQRLRARPGRRPPAAVTR